MDGGNQKHGLLQMPAVQRLSGGSAKDWEKETIWRLCPDLQNQEEIGQNLTAELCSELSLLVSKLVFLNNYMKYTPEIIFLYHFYVFI